MRPCRQSPWQPRRRACWGFVESLGPLGLRESSGAVAAWAEMSTGDTGFGRWTGRVEEGIEGRVRWEVRAVIRGARYGRWRQVCDDNGRVRPCHRVCRVVFAAGQDGENRDGFTLPFVLSTAFRRRIGVEVLSAFYREPTAAGTGLAPCRSATAKRAIAGTGDAPPLALQPARMGRERGGEAERVDQQDEKCDMKAASNAQIEPPCCLYANWQV